MALDAALLTQAAATLCACAFFSFGGGSFCFTLGFGFSRCLSLGFFALKPCDAVLLEACTHTQKIHPHRQSVPAPQPEAHCQKIRLSLRQQSVVLRCCSRCLYSLGLGCLWGWRFKGFVVVHRPSSASQIGSGCLDLTRRGAGVCAHRR